MVQRLRSHRPRQGAAWVAGIAWLLGLYALPLLHNLDHRPDHTHGPAKEPQHDHRPAAKTHGHHDDHGSRSGRHEPVDHDDDRTPIDDPDHGIGSVLHFAVAAFLEQAQSLPEPGPVVEIPRPRPGRRVSVSTPLLTFPRGPPLG